MAKEPDVCGDSEIEKSCSFNDDSDDSQPSVLPPSVDDTQLLLTTGQAIEIEIRKENAEAKEQKPSRKAQKLSRKSVRAGRGLHGAAARPLESDFQWHSALHAFSSSFPDCDGDNQLGPGGRGLVYMHGAVRAARRLESDYELQRHDILSNLRGRTSNVEFNCLENCAGRGLVPYMHGAVRAALESDYLFQCLVIFYADGDNFAVYNNQLASAWRLYMSVVVRAARPLANSNSVLDAWRLVRKMVRIEVRMVELNFVLTFVVDGFPSSLILAPDYDIISNFRGLAIVRSSDGDFNYLESHAWRLVRNMVRTAVRVVVPDFVLTLVDRFPSSIILVPDARRLVRDVIRMHEALPLTFEFSSSLIVAPDPDIFSSIRGRVISRSNVVYNNQSSPARLVPYGRSVARVARPLKSDDRLGDEFVDDLGDQPRHVVFQRLVIFYAVYEHLCSDVSHITMEYIGNNQLVPRTRLIEDEINCRGVLRDLAKIIVEYSGDEVDP